MDKAILEQFTEILGNGRVLTDKYDLFCYSYDGTAALAATLPGAVLRPKTTEEVSEIVKIAAKHKIPVYTRGAGTNLSGGSVPMKDGIVISMLDLDRIIEIDPVNLNATVEAGVVIQNLADQLAPYGLLYPPDPGTVKTATMGGSLSECSGGLRGLKYGVTKDYIMGVTAVLADGSIVKFGNKCIKNVAGFDMKSIFVGSEGLLGIVTEILVKLIPAPEGRKTMMVVYSDIEKAADTVIEICANKIIQATMELLDNMTIRAVEQFKNIGLPVEAEAILLIEVDGAKEAVENEAAKVAAICGKCGADEVIIAQDDAKREELWNARRAAIPALNRMKATGIMQDATVPRSELSKMFRAVNEVAEKHGVLIGTFAHAGDGNLHPMFLTDENDPVEMERVHGAISDIFDAALSMGGTISGEHGIGVAKAKYMQRQFSEAEIAIMKRLKAAFDPDNILNPGKMFV